MLHSDLIPEIGCDGELIQIDEGQRRTSPSPAARSAERFSHSSLIRIG